MKKTILIVMEENRNLADQTLRLVEAQGLLARMTKELGEACELLSQSLDIVVLTAQFAVSAVRTTLFTGN